MEGLLPWPPGEGRGIQVWRDPARAGRSAMTLGVDDLDALVARLDAAGVDNSGAEPGGGARLVRLTDPDGNLVVVTGS